MQFDYHRLLITHHSDQTVRFYDISSHLLLSTSPLKAEYPQIIPQLFIDVKVIINLLEEQLGDRKSPQIGYTIKDVLFAKNALECVVVLDSGDVIWYKFKEAGSPSHVYFAQDENMGPEILSLDHLVTAEQRRRSCFHPICLVRRSEASFGISPAAKVTAVAFSDVGKYIKHSAIIRPNYLLKASSQWRGTITIWL